jgi:murein endopeptidase
MHSILLDWNDDDALTILRHIRDAMTPGYSKLLIHDMIMPRSGSTRLQTSVDMQIWVMTSARVRTEEEFEHIFAKAGLGIVRIDKNHLSVTSIVELAVLTT